MATVTLNVGMSCSHCVTGINDLLLQVAGIEKIAISLKDQTVTLDFNEDVVMIDNIKELLSDACYDVK